MPKNIVLCCDGTNNQFGRTNTNVVRLYQCLDLSDPKSQVAFYDPGVGTLSAPSIRTSIGRLISRCVGLAFGAGITGKIEDAVTFLMRSYEPGDHVFIFGFSRGAFTARAVAGLLYKCGLPYPLADAQWRYFMNRYRDDVDDVITREFKTTFGRECPIHFLGLWDTVSTIGWIYNPTHFAFTRENPSVHFVRHAVSLDEHRCFYRQNLWSPLPGQDVKERWFSGVHSDVGGGYSTDESALWKITFEWMTNEAVGVAPPLRLDTTKTAGLLAPKSSPNNEWYRSKMHTSLKGWWWACEYLPRRYWSNRDRNYRVMWPRGRPRFVAAGTQLDATVIERIKTLPEYRPKNLCREFVEQCVSTPLSSGREAVTYEPCEQSP